MARQQQQKPERELNTQMEKFCQEYIKDPEHQAKAAVAAGYSAKTATVKASKLMSDPRIMARIAELMSQRVYRTKIGADYVLKRLVEIDELDLLDIMNDDLTLKPLSAWPKAWRQFLSGLKVAELFEGQGDEKQVIGVLKSIKWPDKVKNLELIGKHVDVNAFKEVHEHTVNVTLAERMQAARTRAAGGDA